MRIRSLILALSSLTLAAGCSDDTGTPVDADTPEEDAMMPMEDAAMPDEDAAAGDAGTEDMGTDPVDMGTEDDMGVDTDGCVATTCEAAGAECGSIDDGCGGTLDCGGDDVCVAAEGANGTCNTTTNLCECTASACGTTDCGTIDDGCGGTVDCGTDCSGVGTNATCNTTTNLCECTVSTCGTDDCGTIDDGCGGTLDCGTDCSGLGANGTCNTTTNLCECTANTCGASDCGTIDDGCGGTVDCGTDCSGLGANGTCNTTTNTCECTPDTCAATSCGMPDDGCGTALDCGTCTGVGESCNTTTFTCEVTAIAPMAGDVLINEVLYDPNGPLSENNAEWIELLNPTAMPLNLNGCTLSDASATGSTTIGAVVIPPGGFTVFARSASMADNGLTTPVAGTFSFSLNNTGGDTVTLTCGGTTIDTITYDDGGSWPDASSASISRDPSATSAASSNVPGNWCLGTDAYYDAGGTDEHRGTPGMANPGCPLVLPGFCRTQFPETISAAPGEPTTVYGRVYAMGITDATVMTDPDASLVAELGYGPAGTDASSASGWTWQSAAPNTGYTGSGGEENNDEYQADLAVFDPGTWDYVYRFSIDGGSSFLYCNTGGPGTSGSTAYDPTLNGELTVGPYGSDDITAIRDAVIGVVDIDVDLVYVTYIKPAVGTDPAGFFVQADPTGPAVFVAVDPSGLTVGDGITFTATELTTSGGQTWVSTLGAPPTIVTSGFDVETLRQDLSSATDLVSALGDYEHELLTLDATVSGAFSGAGTDHLAAPIDTAGISGDADFQIRLPASVVASTGVRQGCDITLNGAMWRFFSEAQASGWVDADLTVNGCTAPVVSAATATDATTVVVTFDVDLDPSSVLGDGSQFTIGGLTVSAASVSGNQVTLTTSAQTAGTSYTVTVAASVTDEFGTGVDAASNTAMFSGFAGAPVLIFSEYVEGSGNNKAVEITNIGAGDQALGSCEVRQYSNGAATASRTIPLDTRTLGSDDSHVLCNSGSTAALSASCDQASGSLDFNGDDALELWCDGTLLDIFGQVGFDPGSAWSGDCDPPRTAVSTQDTTLRRICSVIGGRTVNGAFCPATEWDGFAQDTFSGLGTHCM